MVSGCGSCIIAYLGLHSQKTTGLKYLMKSIFIIFALLITVVFILIRSLLDVTFHIKYKNDCTLYSFIVLGFQFFITAQIQYMSVLYIIYYFLYIRSAVCKAIDSSTILIIILLRSNPKVFFRTVIIK